MPPNSSRSLDTEAILSSTAIISNNNISMDDAALASPVIAGQKKKLVVSPQADSEDTLEGEKGPDESFDDFMKLMKPNNDGGNGEGAPAGRSTSSSSAISSPSTKDNVASPSNKSLTGGDTSDGASPATEEAAVTSPTSTSGNSKHSTVDPSTTPEENNKEAEDHKDEPSRLWLEAAVAGKMGEPDTPTPTSQQGGPNVNGEEGTNGEVEENSNDNDESPSKLMNEKDYPKSRRRSSELKAELQGKCLLNSVNTVDSWGGHAETLAPLKGTTEVPTKSETPDDEDDQGNISDLDDGSVGSAGGEEISSPPAIKASGSDDTPRKRATSDPAVDSADNVANFVNVNKLLDPSSSNYYYTKSNRDNRKKLEKLKSKKQIHSSFDESMHSVSSVISHRSTSSSYRGETQRKKKDGSKIKSAMKRIFGPGRTSESGLASVKSTPIGNIGSTVETSNSTGEGKLRLRRCAFSSVDIREHERVAGDNPCVTSGVPLSIGWGYYQHDPIKLDDYEENKGPSRDKIEMMVPAGVRRSMLRDEFGVSINDMNAAMRDVNVIKRQRRHTVATEHLEGWTEVAQSAKRKFNRFLKRTSTAKEAQKMWDEAHKSAVKQYINENGKESLGKNPMAVSRGEPGVGPELVADDEEAPFLEISFPLGKGGDEEAGAPTF